MNHPDSVLNELKGLVMKGVKDDDLANVILQDVFIKSGQSTTSQQAVTT